MNTKTHVSFEKDNAIISRDQERAADRNAAAEYKV